MSEIKKVQHFDFLSHIHPDDEKVLAYGKKLEEEKLLKKQQELENNYKNQSGVATRFLNESLETYKPCPENKHEYEWLLGFIDAVKKHENKKNIVYLSGKFGTGKTHLGCGIIRKLGGKIITSLELCITYDSCKDFKSPVTRIQFLKNLCTNTVLVIDEVGKGINNIEKEILPYIVNEFYGSGNLLIFLGNTSKEEFNKIIGDAGVDRMSEVGAYLSLVGESCRRNK